MSDAREANSGNIWKGLFVAALTNLAGLTLAFTILAYDPFFLGAFGALQFVWLIPLSYFYNKRGKTEDAKGVLVAAGITVLLSAACWAALSRCC